MSTRSTMYYHAPEDGTPKFHIYRELMDDPPDDVRIEIDTGYALLNMPVPLTLRELIWPGSTKA